MTAIKNVSNTMQMSAYKMFLSGAIRAMGLVIPQLFLYERIDIVYSIWDYEFYTE